MQHSENSPAKPIAPRLMLGLMTLELDISRNAWSIEFKSKKAALRFAESHLPAAHWESFTDLAKALNVNRVTVYGGNRRIGKLEHYDFVPID